MASLIFPNQTKFYQGKVRDVYTIDSRWLVMIASDRISAFDVILPKLIPYKGQVLNQIAAFMSGESQRPVPLIVGRLEHRLVLRAIRRP